MRSLPGLGRSSFFACTVSRTLVRSFVTTLNLEFMRATGFAVVLLAAAQPGQAYLMGRAGLPFTNAAFREVASQAIQTSVCTIPETLCSLQTPASIGGMVNTFDQFGSCVKECQRNSIDLSCSEAVLAPPDTASHMGAAEVRTPIIGEMLRHRSWFEVAPHRDDGTASARSDDDLKAPRVHTQERSSGRPRASGDSVPACRGGGKARCGAAGHAVPQATRRRRPSARVAALTHPALSHPPCAVSPHRPSAPAGELHSLVQSLGVPAPAPKRARAVVAQASLAV